MTEHFTRTEAATLAKAAGFEVRRVLGLRESVPEVVFAHGLIDEEVTALCNAAVTAIDKKREAQGAVGVVNVSNGYKGIPNIAVAWMQEVSHGAKLYTHALPAPAVGVQTEQQYKLLGHGDKIQPGDVVLSDDTVTWLPLYGWEVGMEWGGHLMPMRRAASPKIGGV